MTEIRAPAPWAASLILFLTAAHSGCAAPEACRAYPAGDKPLSFAALVSKQGKSPAEWQTQLQQAFQSALGWADIKGKAEAMDISPRADKIPPEARQPSDVAVSLETIVSPRDGERFHVLFISPRPPKAPVGLVILLHGHSASIWDAIDPGSELEAAGTLLAQAGFAVAVPELRGFGDFTPGGRGHRRYVWLMGDGDYLRNELADILAARRRLKALFPGAGALSVVGHSLGGYLALHFAALDPEVARAVVSGIFVPYDCLDTDYHHACQHFEAVARLADTPDIGGLIAPRRLLVEFGGKDRFHTPAVEEGVQKAKAVFSAFGAPDAFAYRLDPNRRHVLDAAGARDFLLTP